jgi:hypothetical protein
MFYDRFAVLGLLLFDIALFVFDAVCYLQLLGN